MMKAVLIRHTILISATLLCFVSGCGPKKKVKVAKPAPIGSTETGIASWYGDPYHGRRAANGEIYDMEKLTAAHRTLPFGTWVRVRNLTNDKTVDVRIQDRGPFVHHRIIDLSRAAAREIELLGPGTTKVKLTVIAPPPVRETVATAPPPVRETVAAAPVAITPPPAVVAATNLFAVQIGAFQDRVRAQSLAANMRELYGAARIVVREGKTRTHRVLVGEEDSNEKANALAERLRRSGTDGFVVRLDDPADSIK
ncbi:MAG: septal ring lytic transglycosylase RlpA family protein [Bryobacteraceae bacterium]